MEDLDIWQEIVGIGAQKAELGKTEDWNMGIGIIKKEGGLKKIDTII